MQNPCGFIRQFVFAVFTSSRRLLIFLIVLHSSNSNVPKLYIPSIVQHILYIRMRLPNRTIVAVLRVWT